MGLVFNANLDVGEGYGGRFAARFESDDDIFDDSVGVTYFRTDHDDRTTGERARTHGVLFDGSRHVMLIDGDVGLEATFGVGAGVVVFDFEREYEDEFSLAASARGRLDLVGFGAARIGVGATGFLVGYPSETIAYGGFVDVAVTVDF